MGSAERRQSLRLGVSGEALEVLKRRGSDGLRSAELLWQTLRSEQEPHPRVVREVYQALLDARAQMPPRPTGTLEKISGVFSRRGSGRDVLDVIGRFEKAFISPS